MEEARKFPNCFRCQFFYVTWDEKRSRGCRRYGFKTPDLPAQVVFRQSREHCLSFAEKAGLPPDSTETDSSQDVSEEQKLSSKKSKRDIGWA